MSLGSRFRKFLLIFIKFTGTYPLDENFRISFRSTGTVFTHQTLVLYGYICYVFSSHMLIEWWDTNYNTIFTPLEYTLSIFAMFRHVFTVIWLIVQREHLKLVADDMSKLLQHCSLGESSTAIKFIFCLSVAFVSNIICFSSNFYLESLNLLQAVLFVSEWVFFASSVCQWVVFLNDVVDVYIFLTSYPNTNEAMVYFTEVSIICESFLELYAFPILLLIVWEFLFLIYYLYMHITIVKYILIFSIIAPGIDSQLSVHFSLVFWFLSFLPLLQCVFLTAFHVKMQVSWALILTVYNRLYFLDILQTLKIDKASKSKCRRERCSFRTRKVSFWTSESTEKRYYWFILYVSSFCINTVAVHTLLIPVAYTTVRLQLEVVPHVSECKHEFY